MRDVRERQGRGQGAAADAGPGGWGVPGARSSRGERAPTAEGSRVQRVGEAPQPLWRWAQSGRGRCSGGMSQRPGTVGIGSGAEIFH